MSEEATPTPAAASEAGASASGEAISAPAAEGSTATPASGSAPAASGSTVDWQARAREEQSRADKLAAQLAEARTPAPTPAPTQTVDVGGEIARVLSLRDARDALSTAHPELAKAKPGLFDKYLEYSSPEAFSAAVETEAQAVADLAASLKAAADSEVRALYEERYGPLESPITQGDNAPDGAMTLAKYQALPFADRLKLQREHPEVVAALVSPSTS